jgi:hypothetical protein
MVALKICAFMGWAHYWQWPLPTSGGHPCSNSMPLPLLPHGKILQKHISSEGIGIRPTKHKCASDHIYLHNRQSESMNPCTWGELGHAKVMLLHTYKIKAKIQHSLDFIDLDYKCTYYYTITNTHISLGKRAPKLRFHVHAYTVFTSTHPHIPNHNTLIMRIMTPSSTQRLLDETKPEVQLEG